MNESKISKESREISYAAWKARSSTKPENDQEVNLTFLETRSCNAARHIQTPTADRVHVINQY